MAKLHIAEKLSLPAEEAATETFAILAKRGAGKTYSAKVMAEEVYRAGIPFVAVDPAGVWWGLRSSADGKGPGLEIPILGGRHGDVPLERTGGQLVADLIVDHRLSCVLDISDFESEGAKKQFLLDFARQLYKRNEQPLHLFLEEADDYIPQRPMREEAQLLRAFENIVRRGRTRGLGITLITQRSAVVNKNVLTQVETLIVLRTTSPQDRKAIEDWIEYHHLAKDVLASLPTLEPGEAWVWSPYFLNTLKRVQVRKLETFDSSVTPKGGGKPVTLLADVDLSALRKRMAATIERAKQEDPRELRRQILELRRQLAEAPRGQPAPSPQIKIERVEVPVFKDGQLKRLEATAERFAKSGEAVVAVAREMMATMQQVSKAPVPAPRPASLPKPLPGSSLGPTPTITTTRQPKFRQPGPPMLEGEEISGPQQRILQGLAELEALGAKAPRRPLVALLAGYTNISSKGFVNALSALHARGLIEYGVGSTVSLNEMGRSLVSPPSRPMTTQELQERLMALLGGATARILKAVLDIYPDPMSREDVATQSGYTNVASKGFVNALSRLHSLGFVEYSPPGYVVASPVLFLE